MLCLSQRQCRYHQQTHAHKMGTTNIKSLQARHSQAVVAAAVDVLPGTARRPAGPPKGWHPCYQALHPLAVQQQQHMAPCHKLPWQGVGSAPHNTKTCHAQHSHAAEHPLPSARTAPHLSQCVCCCVMVHSVAPSPPHEAPRHGSRPHCTHGQHTMGGQPHTWPTLVLLGWARPPNP
jgi:hypothetical protein